MYSRCVSQPFLYSLPLSRLSLALMKSALLQKPLILSNIWVIILSSCMQTSVIIYIYICVCSPFVLAFHTYTLPLSTFLSLVLTPNSLPLSSSSYSLSLSFCALPPCLLLLLLSLSPSVLSPTFFISPFALKDPPSRLYHSQVTAHG
jgi:hypothetical protein